MLNSLFRILHVMLRRCEFCSCGNTGSSLHQCLEHALAGTQAVVAAPAEYTEKRALESGIIGRFGSETHRFARFDNINKHSFRQCIKYFKRTFALAAQRGCQGKGCDAARGWWWSVCPGCIDSGDLEWWKGTAGFVGGRDPVWPGFPSSSSFPIY